MLSPCLFNNPRATTWILRAPRSFSSSSVLYGNSSSFLFDSPEAHAAATHKEQEDGDAAVAAADLKPVYYIPKKERGSKNMTSKFIERRLGGETRMIRGGRLCPTRELNYSNVSWNLHKSPFRKFRHISKTFGSAAFQRLLFPDLTAVAVVSLGLTYYNEVVLAATEAAVAPLAVNMSGFAGATTAIGLLAAFRLNASYGRYEECRIFWGDINNTIRDLACQGLMWMKNDAQKKRFLKLCKAFPMVLMFHLNAKGCYHNMKRSTPANPPFAERIHAEFLAELRDIYDDGRDEADFERISRIKYKGGNTPLDVLTMMRETIAACQDTVDPIYARELDEQVQRLCAAFGASERVLRTPLPTGFTRHSSRLLLIWSMALPFALYPIAGPLGTLPASLLSVYALLGIEDIGVQLEEPFDILPLRQYSDGMFDAINQMEREYTPYELPSAEAVAEESPKRR